MSKLERREVSRSPEIIPLERVFIANRGEIALRVLTACKKRDIGAVVGFSEADKNSLAVRTSLGLSEQDDRYAAAFIGLEQPYLSYGNPQAVIHSARAYECDAVHPGYGFLAEKADAVEAISQAGLRFIGPTAEAIRRVGDKERARAVARKLGIPLLPGTNTLRNFEQAKKAADKLKFPLMLKAQNAGGGSGNRVVHNEDELRVAYRTLAPLFQDMYAEKYLPDASHIEIQVAGDKVGNFIALGERDCSAQRKFQKVIEESPAPTLPADVRRKLSQDAIKMARHVDYHGLGTWEFLYDNATLDYYFLEVNPRIQVEHPVTEERTGIDLVGLQLAIEEGHQLPSLISTRDNHVIEARVYAERPEQDFAPDAGTIQILRHLDLPNDVRIDTGFAEGDTMPAHYDRTVEKIIAKGATREEARLNLVKALEGLTITGIASNREFLLWLLNTREFREGTITTTFIESAWKKHQRERMGDVSHFIADGEFIEFTKPVEFDPDTFPQDLQYEKGGIPRKYGEEIRQFQRENPTTSAFRFGIYEKDGISFALGFWDFRRLKGTLGAEEGNTVVKMLETAAQLHIPAVMLTSSGGARQQENTLSLLQMDYMMSAWNRLKANIPVFINLYHNKSFGGVNASIAEAADLKFATDGTIIGLTGPAMVAEIMGLKDSTALPDGAHSAVDHFWARNIDVIFNDLDDARRQIMNLFYVLPQTNARVNDLYSPDHYSRSFDSLAPSMRYDRPEGHRFRATIAHLVGKTVFHREQPTETSSTRAKLTNGQRMEIIKNPYRPTTVDYLNPEMGIFSNVVPLSNRMPVGPLEQYPSTIAAIAEFHGTGELDRIPVMVIGQQTQRRRDENGNLVKDYVGQKTKDFMWAGRMVELAVKLNLPIVLMGDTEGADASLDSEYSGISNAIKYFLGLIENASVPVCSINIGQCGSGGGLTFIRPVDKAADLSNALTHVSGMDVYGQILLGKRPNAAEKVALHNQLVDATAEGRKRMGQIDTIIQEPPGGAHMNPVFVAPGMKGFIEDWLRATLHMPSQELKDLRFARLRNAATFATIPIKSQ